MYWKLILHGSYFVDRLRQLIWKRKIYTRFKSKFHDWNLYVLHLDVQSFLFSKKVLNLKNINLFFALIQSQSWLKTCEGDTTFFLYGEGHVQQLMAIKDSRNHLIHLHPNIQSCEKNETPYNLLKDINHQTAFFCGL